MLYADATVQEALDIEYAVRGTRANTAATEEASLPQGMIPKPSNFQSADTIELPPAQEGGQNRKMVFSIGGEGMPALGWYEETEQGLMPATGADIDAIEAAGQM